MYLSIREKYFNFNELINYRQFVSRIFRSLKGFFLFIFFLFCLLLNNFVMTKKRVHNRRTFLEGKNFPLLSMNTHLIIHLLILIDDISHEKFSLIVNNQEMNSTLKSAQVWTQRLFFGSTKQPTLALYPQTTSSRFAFSNKINLFQTRNLPTKAWSTIKRKIIFSGNPATNKIQLYIPKFSRFLFSFIYFFTSLFFHCFAKKAINYFFQYFIFFFS